MTPNGWQSVTDLIQNLAIIVLGVLWFLEHRLRRHIPNVHITLQGNLKPDACTGTPDEQDIPQ